MFFIWQDKKEKREIDTFFVRAREFLIIFNYEQMKYLDYFNNIWDVEDVLFSFVGGEIHFIHGI